MRSPVRPRASDLVHSMAPPLVSSRVKVRRWRSDAGRCAPLRPASPRGSRPPRGRAIGSPKCATCCTPRSRNAPLSEPPRNGRRVAFVVTDHLFAFRQQVFHALAACAAGRSIEFTENPLEACGMLLASDEMRPEGFPERLGSCFPGHVRQHFVSYFSASSISLSSARSGPFGRVETAHR